MYIYIYAYIYIYMSIYLEGRDSIWKKLPSL